MGFGLFDVGEHLGGGWGAVGGRLGGGWAMGGVPQGTHGYCFQVLKILDAFFCPLKGHACA